MTSWVSNSWSAIRSFGSEVESIVKKAKSVAHFASQVVTAAVTGSYSATKAASLASMSWNYEGGGAKNPSISLGSGVTCKNCFANFNANAVFDLQISKYVVRDVSAYIEATASYNIEGHYGNGVHTHCNGILQLS